MFGLLLLSILLANVSQSHVASSEAHVEHLTRLPRPPSFLSLPSTVSSVTTSDSKSPVSGCQSLERNLALKFESNPPENIYIRPSTTSNTTLVSVAIDVKNIRWIHEADSQWKVEMDFFQFWSDPRLAYSNEGCPVIEKFSLPNTDHIWMPDLFFPLAEEGFVHTVPQKNFLLWVTPSGNVTYAVRLTLIMECTGKGSMAGELLCPLIISSYRNLKSKVNIQWLDQSPVEVYWDRLTLKDYQLENVSTEVKDHKIRLGTYAYAVANFIFTKDQCRARPGQSF